MGKKIGLTAGIAVLAAVAGAGLHWRRTCQAVERSATILAAPARVQARIADLQQWTTWSPWERPDADFERRFEGPDSGAGATYSWWGDDAYGAGRMTVVSASPDRVHVRTQIDRPVRRTSDFEFTLAAGESGTLVSWTATCDKDRAGLWERLIGSPVASAADLERGLARLKSVAEAEAAIEVYRVERSTTIAARPDSVQDHIVDLRQWTDWSAREALDRQMREQFSGRLTRAGSTYTWSGRDAVGSGRLTLVDVEPGKVVLEVRVDRPAPSSSDLEFTLAPDGKGTRVTWAIAGEKDASGKVFGLYAVPLDRLGDDMDDCLARLKALVEADSRVARH